MMNRPAIIIEYLFSSWNSGPRYYASYSCWIKCLVFFVLKVHPLSKHRPQPALSQNRRFPIGFKASKTLTVKIETPIIVYHSEQKSSSSPQRSGTLSGSFNFSARSEFSGNLLFSKRMRIPTFRNCTIHILERADFNLSVSLCFPSKWDSSLKKTRRQAFRAEIEIDKPKRTALLTEFSQSQSSHGFSPPSNTMSLTAQYYVFASWQQ